MTTVINLSDILQKKMPSYTELRGLVSSQKYCHRSKQVWGLMRYSAQVGLIETLFNNGGVQCTYSGGFALQYGAIESCANLLIAILMNILLST